MREVCMEVLHAVADRLLVRIDALERIPGYALERGEGVFDRKDEFFDGEGRVGAFEKV